MDVSFLKDQWYTYTVLEIHFYSQGKPLLLLLEYCLTEKMLVKFYVLEWLYYVLNRMSMHDRCKTLPLHWFVDEVPKNADYLPQLRGNFYES